MKNLVRLLTILAMFTAGALAVSHPTSAMESNNKPNSKTYIYNKIISERQKAQRLLVELRNQINLERLRIQRDLANREKIERQKAEKFKKWKSDLIKQHKSRQTNPTYNK